MIGSEGVINERHLFNRLASVDFLPVPPMRSCNIVQIAGFGDVQISDIIFPCDLGLDSTLVGVSGGVDYRFTPKFVGGLGFGYGRDKTDVGGNGTESQGRAWSMAAYGSYKPTPEIFIDGLFGYGLMDFDSRRYVTATGDFATGSRGGQQIFGSLTAGYEYRQDRWLLSPYGRLEASRSKLDAFSESDGGIWGLTYGDQTIDTLSGILGLRLEYALPMDWGVFKPRARLEYTHDFEGSSRAGLGYTDIGTLPYSIDIDQFSRDHLTIGLGFDAQIGDAWNLGFDYQTAYGSGGQSQDHTFAVKVGAVSEASARCSGGQVPSGRRRTEAWKLP